MIQRCAVECYEGMSRSARFHSSSSIDEASVAMRLQRGSCSAAVPGLRGVPFKGFLSDRYLSEESDIVVIAVCFLQILERDTI